MKKRTLFLFMLTILFMVGDPSLQATPTSYPYSTQSYSYPTQSYPYPTQSYPYPTQSYPYPTQSYPYPTQSYPYPTQSYPYPTQSYSYPTQSYPYPTQSYPHPTNKKYFRDAPFSQRKKRKVRQKRLPPTARQKISFIEREILQNRTIIMLADGSAWLCREICNLTFFWTSGDVVEVGIELPSWTNNFTPRLYLVNLSQGEDTEMGVDALPLPKTNVLTNLTTIIAGLYTTHKQTYLQTQQHAEVEEWIVTPANWTPQGRDIGSRVIIAQANNGQFVLLTENGNRYCIIHPNM